MTETVIIIERLVIDASAAVDPQHLRASVIGAVAPLWSDGGPFAHGTPTAETMHAALARSLGAALALPPASAPGGWR